MDSRLLIAIVLINLLLVMELPALPTPDLHLEEEEYYLMDINHQKLPDLRLDEIYSIHNGATDLPLLHDRPGTNLTRFSHWWTLTPIEDNIYYLQIQEIRANLSAPRWNRKIRLEKVSSNPGYYHMYPVACFRYPVTNSTQPKFQYVDYFDANGRDNSECISINSTRNGSKLENENISAKPRDILTNANFQYKFTSLSTALEEKLKESGNRMGLTTNSNSENSENGLILPKLKLHEEEYLMMGKFTSGNTQQDKKILSYDCQCQKEIQVKRPYFTFSIPYWSKFRLNIETAQSSGSSLSIEGSMGHHIANYNELKRSTWTLKWDHGVENIPKTQFPRELSILNIIGINTDGSSSQSSSNYIYWDKNNFWFSWTSSSTSSAAQPQMEVRFGSPEESDLCTCRVPTLWYIHPVNIMGAMIFMVFATLLIYTRVKRGRSEENNLRDTSVINVEPTGHKSQLSSYRGKFQEKYQKMLHHYTLSNSSSCEDKNEKKFMLQNI